jgi:hypothetical protein
VTQNGNDKSAPELSDDLIDKARAIASRSDELLELLEDARQRLLEADPQGKLADRGRPGSQRRFESTSESKPKAAPEATAKSEKELSEGLRLLTSQMSAAGAGRQEIAERLREDFAIDDPEPILKSMGL